MRKGGRGREGGRGCQEHEDVGCSGGEAGGGRGTHHHQQAKINSQKLLVFASAVAQAAGDLRT